MKFAKPFAKWLTGDISFQPSRPKDQSVPPFVDSRKAEEDVVFPK